MFFFNYFVVMCMFDWYVVTIGHAELSVMPLKGFFVKAYKHSRCTFFKCAFSPHLCTLSGVICTKKQVNNCAYEIHFEFLPRGRLTM